MPSTMIHLLIAHKINPKASGLFWIGNFAPDYSNSREIKRKIHLSDTKDRFEALSELSSKLDFSNPFESGWFLHIFTDTCWNEKELLDYKNYFIKTNKKNQWFISYHRELKLVSDYLYNTLPWAKEILKSIESADVSKIRTNLSISLSDIECYRDIVVKKRRKSIPNSIPSFYTMDIIENFADKTISRYIDWMKECV